MIKIKKYISITMVLILLFSFALNTNKVDAGQKRNIDLVKRVQIGSAYIKGNGTVNLQNTTKLLSTIYCITGYSNEYNEYFDYINDWEEFVYEQDINNIDDLARYLIVEKTYRERLVRKILDIQNSDGGYGVDMNYASDILDTEIALRALEEVDEIDAMNNAARYVVSCQNEDGGFGYQPGIASNAELSAEIANILADCVDSDPSLSEEISKNIVNLRNYLDNNAVALDELNSDELGKVYQHFNTALFKLKLDKEYDVTSYYDLQAENGGVFDDSLATAMYLELIVREQNTIKANINGITFTTDEGAMASVYNSYENVNIAVDSTFSEDEGYLKVEVVDPNGNVVEIDTDNLVFETADNDEGSYTVNAYVINKKNEEIADKNTNVFTIHRTFVAEGLDVWFTDCTYVYDENWENINENYGNRISSAHKGDSVQAKLYADVNLKNLEEATEDIIISWALTRKTDEVMNGKITIKKNDKGKYEFIPEIIPCSLIYEEDYDGVDEIYYDEWQDSEYDYDEIVDIGTFSHTFELAYYQFDTSESCTYVLQTDVSLGDATIKSALSTFIVSGQEMSIVTNADKNELIAPEDDVNISVNLREKKIVDLVLVNGTEDVELSNKFADRIEEIKNELESLGYSVNVGAAKSTQYTAQDTFAWQEYDHKNYIDKYVESVPDHIIYDENDIRMIGYGYQPMKDFLYIEGNDESKKVLEYEVQREDNDDWHTLDGAGFLFNTTLKDESIEGYCVMLESDGIYLYKIRKTDLEKFRDGTFNYYGYMYNCSNVKANYSIDNPYAKHKIKIVIEDNYATVYDNDEMIISPVYVGLVDGDGYGPITSYCRHSCSQRSSFRFSNIKMKALAGKNLYNTITGDGFESNNSRYILCLNDKEDEFLLNQSNFSNVKSIVENNNITLITIGNDTNKNVYNELYETTTYVEDWWGEEYSYEQPAIEGRFFDISEMSILDQLEEYIVSKEESKFVINKNGNKVTDLVFSGILYDGSTYTKTVDEMYEGEQLKFNINEMMGDLAVGTDAPILRDIKLTFKDALGDTCTATASDMYLPVKAYTDSFTNKLTTDSDEYMQYSNAILINRIYNNSKKKTGKHLVSVINVKNAEGNVIKTYSKELNEIMVSSNADHTEVWNIEDSIPGEYIVEAAIYDGNYLVSKDEKIIAVKEYPVDYIELDGSISLSQKLLKNTDTLNITKYVKNTGINVVKDAKEEIRIVKVTDGVDSETIYSEEISLNLGRGEESKTQVSIIPNVDLTDFSNGEYYIFHEVVLGDGTILQLEGDGFILETEEKIELDKIFGDGALISLNTDDSVNGIELNGAIITVGGTMHSNTNIVGNTSILNITNLYESVLPNTFNAMVTNITNESRMCGVIDTPAIDVPLVEKDIVIESPIYDNYTDKGSLLASEGDITIRSSYARFKGLIYAPNGTVTIESATFNMDGRIIAKNIIYKGSVLTVNTYDGDLDLLK